MQLAILDQFAIIISYDKTTRQAELSMTADVLHGTWLPERKLFFIWGETAEADKPKGRKKLPPHPFAAPIEDVRHRVERIGAGRQRPDRRDAAILAAVSR